MTRIEQFKQALLHQTQRNHEFSVLCDGCNLAAVLLDEKEVTMSTPDAKQMVERTARVFTEVHVSEAQAVYCVHCCKILEDDGKKPLHALKSQHNREQHKSDQCIYVALRAIEERTRLAGEKGWKG